jgi:hypothetical protein
MQNTSVTSRRACYGVKSLALAGLAALLVGALTTHLHAATFSDHNWTGMGGYPGANGPVNATVVDVSGSDLYVGGEFNYVGNANASYIARWNGKS